MLSYKDFLKSRRYEHAAAITPNDNPVTGAITNCDAINVGTGGTIKLDTVGGEVGVTITVATGQTIPIAATHVYATGTSASGLTALWSNVGS